MRLIYAMLFLLIFAQEGLTQLTYSTTLKPDLLRLSQFNGGNLISTGFLEHDGLTLNDEDDNLGITYLRTYLNKDGLVFINSGGWISAQLYNSLGASGALDLYAGGGTGLLFAVGPDPSDLTRGRLRLYDDGVTKAEMDIFDNAGTVSTNGQNGSSNAGLTWPSGRPNAGYVVAQDPNGQIQAALLVNADGTGTVFADTKNFRMEHPEQPGKEIWYASLEGPEAAAYERGTAKLQYGQAFIPFSDHFQLVVNPETMTVILTPHSADTYGLAVVEKTPSGIRVKEFKGGTGNFSFDWEVKGVRKGYENYRVIRDASEVLPGHPDGTVLSETTAPTGSLVPQNKEEGPEAETEILLKQNQPNPSNGQTIIGYSVPRNIGSAEMQIFDAAGKLIKLYRLQAGPDGQLEIPTNTFAPGMYSYSLWVEGQLKASRQMVIAR